MAETKIKKGTWTIEDDIIFANECVEEGIMTEAQREWYLYGLANIWAKYYREQGIKRPKAML